MGVVAGWSVGMEGGVGRGGCGEVVCICSWGGGRVGELLMSFDNFLLFWGLGRYRVVAGMECGCGEWGGQWGLECGHGGWSGQREGDELGVCG